MIETYLPLPVTAAWLGILIGTLAARVYIHLKARNLNHVFGYDPDGYPAAASYDSRKNEIVHRFKHYDRLSVVDIEENIDIMILWAELEELTHWAGHMDVEPGHSNDWMYTLLDVACYINDVSAWGESEEGTEIIADYSIEEVELTK